MSHDGAFWLVFTPLAVDATPASMRQVIEEIRVREPGMHERAELYAAMIVLAELDPWGHNLREEIRRMVEELDQEFIMGHSFLREVFEKGIAKGMEQGREKGIEQLLQRLFMRRLHRDLTPAEQTALSARARTLDVDRAADALAELDADALLAWLLGPEKR